MYNTEKTIGIIMVCVCIHLNIQASEKEKASAYAGLEKIEWDNSLSLPSPARQKNIGVMGAFSGWVGNGLIVAGGTNYPYVALSHGGERAWSHTIYYLDLELSRWTILKDTLPSALAYGVSVELREGLLCIGGCNSSHAYDTVFLLQFQDGKIRLSDDWPSLPVRLINASGVLSDNKVYVAGGRETTEGAPTHPYFYMLDLSNRKKGWQSLPSWPGEARRNAVMAVQSDGFDHCIYLFSGLTSDKDGSPRIITDGFAYNPRLKTWKKLGPKFSLAGGMAVATGANHILLLGGASEITPGTNDLPAVSRHSVYLYHTITDTFIKKEEIPYPIPSFTNVAERGKAFYVISGEIKPGVSTPALLKGRIIPFEKSLGTLNTIVILAYFSVLAWMGYYFSKKQKNTDDYFKGGGRLPWWAVGLSIFGTGLSAITFMSIPAKAYASDWSYLLMNAGIIMVVPFVVYLFIPFYRKLNVTTAYEYLELRFNASIRVICSLAFILFQVGRMGIVMYLPAIALNVVTGIDIFVCIALMGVLSLLYTMMGGIEAVVWTDALQVVILLGGALVVTGVAVSDLPEGLGGVISEASVANKFDLGSLDFDLRRSTVWTVLIATFFTNLTTYGTDQTMVQRYMTTETRSQANKSVLTNALLIIPSTVLFFFVGTVLYVYYKQNPAELSLTLTEGDAILPWYIYTRLPAGVTGLLIAGILAAAMSTLSSSMNSAATAYVTDIHQKITSVPGSLKTAKIWTFLLGGLGILFALMMATWDINSLWDQFNRILGLVLGSMGGLFVLGMLTKRANATGALCGVAGSVFVQLFVVYHQTVHLLLYTATGFVSCFVIGYLVSLVLPGSQKRVNLGG